MGYYSDDPEIEAMMIEEFGEPDTNYNEALKKCYEVDIEKTSTEELYNIVKWLEPEGYFDGRKTREFIISFINWQREREKDAQSFAMSSVKMV